MPTPGPIGLRMAIANARQPKSRLEKFLGGWLLGKPGLTGAAIDFANSVDPRTPAGAASLASIFVPGNFSREQMSDTALAINTGHLNHRPYSVNDPIAFGGGTFGNRDIGYSGNALKNPNLRKNYVKTIHQALSNINSDEIRSPGLQKLYDAINEANPNRLPDPIIKLLQKPYNRSKRAMNN